MVKAEAMSSLAEFRFLYQRSPAEWLATVKKLLCDASMSHQCLMGMVHMERGIEVECPICIKELTQKSTVCCRECYSLICTLCHDKLGGKCPMCRCQEGFSPSIFVNMLISSSRERSSREASQTSASPDGLSSPPEESPDESHDEEEEVESPTEDDECDKDCLCAMCI